MEKVDNGYTHAVTIQFRSQFYALGNNLLRSDYPAKQCFMLSPLKNSHNIPYYFMGNVYGRGNSKKSLKLHSAGAFEAGLKCKVDLAGVDT